MLPLKDTIPSRSFPAVNWLIIAVNLAVFIYETSLGPRQLEGLVGNFGVIPADLLSGAPQEFVTLFTSMFLHGGWLHVISNLWALFIFGDNVEDRMGSGRYLVFYLLAGLVGGLTQVFVGPTSTVPAIGASGAIAGVLGAYLVLFPTARVITLIPFFFLPWFVEIPAIIYLAFWGITQFYQGVASLAMPAAQSGVAYWAHVGGFATGLLLVWLFARRPRAFVRRYDDEFAPW